jgi:16S rRNA (cytidine1402-2'-O)-methyltransferase
MDSSLYALIQQAAAAAAGMQAYPQATLYVVATPIGNLADLSLRAVHVLSLVDAVACEDTRHSGALLRHLGLDKPLLALHAHNEKQASHEVMARLARSERVAYVSDAGTPAVSDPGAVLVACVTQAGYRCLPVPGASSALAALSVAGDALGTGFIFKGFLPAKGQERQREILSIAQCPQTQILFEAPHRIEALALNLAEHAGQRTITLCKELTKQFETVLTLRADALPDWLARNTHHTRGEFVLVVHAHTPAQALQPSQAYENTLRILLSELPLKQAVSLGAKLTGVARNKLYDKALQMKADDAT